MTKVSSIIKKNTMVIALIIVTILFAFMTQGKILLPQNITNLISQNAYVVILAVGMLLCILTGGNIDLSVGSVVALVGAVAGKLIVEWKVNIGVSILITLFVGVLIGAWQGFWIAYVRIPPFIVTLAGMLLWRGVALIILDGLTISPFPDVYSNIFNSYIPDIFSVDLSSSNIMFLGSTIKSVNVLTIIIGAVIIAGYIIFSLINRKKRVSKGYEVQRFTTMLLKTIVLSIVIMLVTLELAFYKGLPTGLIILAVIVVVYAFFTSKTVPGRHLYGVGGNEKAAKLSGIDTNRVLFGAYTNMAFLAAVAALFCVARFNSAAPTAGTNYELDAISSCFIGGASAYGGTGTVGGAVIGAILMGVINNGMSIMGVDSNWQKVVKGLVLLGAVAFDVVSKRKEQTK